MDDIDEYISLLPLDAALDDSESPTCETCKKSLLGQDEVAENDDGFHCLPCMKKKVQQWTFQAKHFAKLNCKIIRELPVYDPEFEHKCTPQEFEDGFRESYTVNAFLCHCRHNCTNYDVLIKPLEKMGGTRDRVFHGEIRNQIHKLLADAGVDTGDE